MESNCLRLFCSFFFYFCTGQQQQSCTSLVYNGSTIVTIRGPCSSFEILVPVGSTITFECFYSYTGSYLSFWNITDIECIINVNSLNSDIIVTTHGSSNGYTIFTLLITKQDSVDVQCGLVLYSYLGNCYQMLLFQ